MNSSILLISICRVLIGLTLIVILISVEHVLFPLAVSMMGLIEVNIIFLMLAILGALLMLIGFLKLLNCHRGN